MEEYCYLVLICLSQQPKADDKITAVGSPCFTARVVAVGLWQK